MVRTQMQRKKKDGSDKQHKRSTAVKQSKKAGRRVDDSDGGSDSDDSDGGGKRESKARQQGPAAGAQLSPFVPKGIAESSDATVVYRPVNSDVPVRVGTDVDAAAPLIRSRMTVCLTRCVPPRQAWLMP